MEILSYHVIDPYTTIFPTRNISFYYFICLKSLSCKRQYLYCNKKNFLFAATKNKLMQEKSQEMLSVVYSGLQIKIQTNKDAFSTILCL